MASNQPHTPPEETAPVTQAGRLRRLIEEGELVVAPGIFDGISAHLVRRMGFLAGYLTGAAIPSTAERKRHDDLALAGTSVTKRRRLERPDDCWRPVISTRKSAAQSSAFT